MTDALEFRVSSLRMGGERLRHYTVIHLPTGRVAEFDSERPLERSEAIERFRAEHGDSLAGVLPAEEPKP